MTIDWLSLAVAKAPEYIGAIVGFLALRRKLIDIHLTMNSRLDELIRASKAMGRQEERDSHSVTVPGIPRNPEKP